MNFEDFYKTIYRTLRQKRQGTSVYMPETMLEKLRRMSKEHQVSQSDLILYAIIKTYGEERTRG